MPIGQFLERYAPLYERREAIIAGKAEPTEAEIEAGKAADSDDEDEEEEEARITEVTDEKEGDEKVTGIPEFWLTALRNHAPISDTITDRDEEVSAFGSVTCYQDSWAGLESIGKHLLVVP